MDCKARAIVLAVVALISIAAPASSSETRKELSAQAAFTELASLVGNWRTAPSVEPAHSVSYRLSANGTALIETWQLSPTRESMTIYTLDGAELVATHFCPQGNQPRLKLIRESTGTQLDFRIVDGLNLREPGREHQAAFSISIANDGSFSRSETYVPNGSLHGHRLDRPAEWIHYVRVPAQDGL